jgi:hypothetical protein
VTWNILIDWEVPVSGYQPQGSGGEGSPFDLEHYNMDHGLSDEELVGLVVDSVLDAEVDQLLGLLWLTRLDESFKKKCLASCHGVLATALLGYISRT